MKSNKLGFSLIELLVALSILAVVAAIIVPRFLNVRDQAAQTMAQSQVKALNSVYSNWIALGGTPGAATGVQIVRFLSTPSTGSGPNAATRGLTGQPCTDTLGNFGSYTVSFTGVTVDTSMNGTAVPVQASSPDGFYNATAANGVSAGLGYKIGGIAFPIAFNVLNAQPFSITDADGQAITQ